MRPSAATSRAPSNTHRDLPVSVRVPGLRRPTLMTGDDGEMPCAFVFGHRDQVEVERPAHSARCWTTWPPRWTPRRSWTRCSTRAARPGLVQTGDSSDQDIGTIHALVAQEPESRSPAGEADRRSAEHLRCDHALRCALLIAAAVNA